MDKNIKLNIDSSELDRLVIGGRMYDALTFSTTDCINVHGIIKIDKDTGDILINESELLKLMQLANRFINNKYSRIRCDKIKLVKE